MRPSLIPDDSSSTEAVPAPAALLDRLAEAERRATEAEARIARVRSMRAVATAGTVTTAAIDWALGEAP